MPIVLRRSRNTFTSTGAALRVDEVNALLGPSGRATGWTRIANRRNTRVASLGQLHAELARIMIARNLTATRIHIANRFYTQVVLDTRARKRCPRRTLRMRTIGVRRDVVAVVVELAVCARFARLDDALAPHQARGQVRNGTADPIDGSSFGLVRGHLRVRVLIERHAGRVARIVLTGGGRIQSHRFREARRHPHRAAPLLVGEDTIRALTPHAPCARLHPAVTSQHAVVLTHRDVAGLRRAFGARQRAAISLDVRPVPDPSRVIAAACGHHRSHGNRSEEEGAHHVLALRLVEPGSLHGLVLRWALPSLRWRHA